MEIQRNIISSLLNWKQSKYRKPLVLQGARQVGKTFVLEYFGKTCFDNFVYIDFDREAEHRAEFAKTKNPQRLLSYLSAVKGVKIEPQTTLIIFDEIQECNDALNSLKYFYQDAPGYAVVAAGSLLGVAMKRSGASFPVGKVDFLTLYPVCFDEFLRMYDVGLYDYLHNFLTGFELKNNPEQIPEIFHSQLIDAYKVYICCGGMPETLVRRFETKSWDQVEIVSKQILTSFTLDFAKHIAPKDIPRVIRLWGNIQDNLAKEDRKFRYALLEKNARGKNYEDAVEWLVLAGLVHRIFEVQTAKIPLANYKNTSAFKLYLLDTGLLRTKFNIDPAAILLGNKLFTEFRGVLTENYVLQTLKRQFGNEIFYWTSGNTAEIEFMLQFKNEIIPVEAKSAESVKSRSLSEYRKNNHPNLSVRFSLKNIAKSEDFVNLPLYLADYMIDIISPHIARINADFDVENNGSTK
ncbi:MAG: ATP-binding protein [Bacteroidales bacterium]|jgi:predicted AAA+ superfamily ATPase|nr:ATP-binding protein [Bacteroidales bacterium]